MWNMERGVRLCVEYGTWSYVMRKMWNMGLCAKCATLLLHDDGEFQSRQLCGYERGLLDELVQPATTVCQSTVMCRTSTFIGIVRIP